MGETTMETTEELAWEPKAKPQGGREKAAPQTAGLPNPKASIPATLLQEMAECPKKAYLHLKGNPERLGPSPFAREKFQDGRVYEERMISSGRAQTLVQEQFEISESVDIHNLQNIGKKLPAEQKAQKHALILAAISQGKTPALAFQIQLMEKSGGETTRAGIADLALWTGKVWILGEIKCTTRPKTHAALQLYHYREIWKNWAPKGDQTSTKIFVLHCRDGWQFEQSTPKREQDCIRFSTATLFEVPLAKPAYERAWKELARLKIESVEPKSEFCVHCPECPQRLTCYKEFAESATKEALGLGFADLDPSDTAKLKEELGIETIQQALEKIESLEDLHENNPQIKKELVRKLRQANVFGGCSTWAPPKKHENVIFHCRAPENQPSPRWMVNGQSPQEDVPQADPESLIVAFSRREMQAALGLLKSAHGHQGKWKAISLQEELETETRFAYENLSLRGMLNTLEGTLAAQSWAEHAKKNLIPWLETTLTHPEAERPGKRVRIEEIAALWETMLQIYGGMPPE